MESISSCITIEWEINLLWVMSWVWTGTLKTIKWMTNIDVIPKSEINVKIKCKVYVRVKQFSKTFKLCFGS